MGYYVFKIIGFVWNPLGSYAFDDCEEDTGMRADGD